MLNELNYSAPALVTLHGAVGSMLASLTFGGCFFMYSQWYTTTKYHSMLSFLLPYVVAASPGIAVTSETAICFRSNSARSYANIKHPIEELRKTGLFSTILSYVARQDSHGTLVFGCCFCCFPSVSVLFRRNKVFLRLVYKNQAELY